MPNLRGKTWTTTTPANVEDAQYWEDHLISDAQNQKISSSVQSVNNITPDGNGNVNIVALPAGGTAGQVLTKLSSTAGDADWEDPASSGHTIQNASGTDMAYQETLQFLNAEVTNDSVNGKTVVNCAGEKGDKGDKGDTGDTPDITVTSTTDNIASVHPSINVVKSGTTAAPVFDFQFSGFKGAQGDPGSAGPAGAAATVTVGSVTTLPSGSNATVTNVGSTSAAVLDFGIPKGADGTGSISDAFKTIKVGSTSVVAHEADTFKMFAGTNIILSADTTAKSVTITATYPAVDVPDVVNNLTSTSTTDALSAYQGNLLNAAVLLKQDELVEGTGIKISSTTNTISVDSDSTPTNGSQKPASSGGVYTALQGKANTSDVPSVLNDMNDVTITSTTLVANQVLKYTGSQWINDAAPMSGHDMNPDPSDDPDDDDFIDAIKNVKASVNGNRNDEVASLYGIGIWSNTYQKKHLYAATAQHPLGASGLGDWDDTTTYDGWLQLEDLKGILSKEHHIEFIYDPMYFNDNPPVLRGYRIEDFDNDDTKNYGVIAIKFANEISPADRETGRVGVEITIGRDSIDIITPS